MTKSKAGSRAGERRWAILSLSHDDKLARRLWIPQARQSQGQPLFGGRGGRFPAGSIWLLAFLMKAGCDLE
ncbi:MAG: hypothetical protein LBT86_09820 [Deltaproteobacteria bacterium]|jgi:hypothetical protein|nr:hypothetical protein [Deltaproteobacteria bacterium]